MDKTLYNLITYNYKLYDALTEDNEKLIIFRLVEKLKFIEREILQATEGSINISPTGAVYVRNYPIRLRNKIER